MRWLFTNSWNRAEVFGFAVILAASGLPLWGQVLAGWGWVFICGVIKGVWIRRLNR